MGERGDPCGTPAGVENLVDCTPLNLILVVRSCKKLSTHLVICGGIFLFFRLWIRRWWWTLLNAPATSMNTAEYILPSLHAVCIFSVSSIIASSVVLCNTTKSLPVTRRGDKLSTDC